MAKLSDTDDNPYSSEDDNDYQYSSPKDPHFQLIDILRLDDKDEFLSFLTVHRMSKELVIALMSSEGGVKCAKAVLEGKTGHRLDDLTASTAFELPPLHVAASAMNPKMVDFFLKHGAPSTLRCVSENARFDGMLPINAALQSICESYDLEDWHSNLSVFNLLVRLCLPQMRAALKTVESLVWKTDGVEEEIYHYAKEGRLVELAAMLLAAPDKVLSPTLFQNSCGSAPLGTMTLRQFIAAEAAILSAEKVRLRYAKRCSENNRLALACKERLAAMMSALLLLEVFSRAGDVIREYLKLERAENQVTREVAFVLQQAGFALKPDDMDLFHASFAGTSITFWKTLQLEEGEKKIWCKNIESQHHQPGLTDSIRLPELGVSHPVPNNRQLSWDKEIAKSRKRQLKYCKVCSTKPKSLTFMLYKQWRFASKVGGFSSLAVQPSYMLISSKDVPGANVDKPDPNGALIVEIANLCNHQYLKDWSWKESIFKLIYILCLPELNEKLKDVKFLACDTEEVRAMGHCYAKEGRNVELAALLMVAREKLIPPISSMGKDSSNSGESLAIRQHVISEMEKIIDQEIALAGTNQNSTSFQTVRRKKVLMLSTVLLLDVFERVGATIEAYLQTPRYNMIKAQLNTKKEYVSEDLTCLLQEWGFVLTPKDGSLTDLDRPTSGSNDLGPRDSESLMREVGMPFNSLPKKVSLMKGTLVDSVLWGQQGTFAASPSLVRLFHSVRESKASLGFKYSAPLGNQVNRIPRKFEPLLFKKQWAFYALALKRGMRCV